MEEAPSTRNRILEASGAIFARDGFHRAGIREICAAAKCNVASVKYYFGDKLGLYRELLLRGAADMKSKRPVERIVEGEPAEATLHRWLRQFLELTLVHRHNHPYMGHIMKHELREPTDVLDEVVQSVVKPIHADLTRILTRLTGKPASETRHTAGLILSMCANLETSRPMFERLSAKLPSTPRELDKFAESLTSFVLYGVKGTPLPMNALIFLLAFAPVAQERMTLSMKQAVDLSLSVDGAARVQLAKELITATQTRVAQSRASLLPNIDGSITEQNFTRNLKAFGVQIPIPGYPDVVGPISVFDARLTASQTVFDFSAMKRVRAAKAQVDVAKAEEEAVRNAVSDAAARAYLSLVRAGEAVATNEANVNLAEALLKLANAQKQAGAATGIEVTRAQVQLANEQQRLLVARNERDRAEIQLLRVIGLKMDVHVDPTDKFQFTPAENVSVNEAIETARQMRADLRVQSRREILSKLNYDAVKWERLPTINAFADAGGIGLDPADSRFTRTVGVSLRIPVFDGGRRDARRAESASNLRQEQIKSRDLQRQIESEIRLAFESLQSAEGQLKVADQGLQLSETELAQARRRYEAGVGASIEVSDAQTRLARARDNRTGALFLHNLAKIELASAMGVIHKVIQ